MSVNLPDVVYVLSVTSGQVYTLNTLKSWSRRFDWRARALLLDNENTVWGDELLQSLRYMQRRAREEIARRAAQQEREARSREERKGEEEHVASAIAARG